MTRALNQKVPKGQNILGSFGGNGDLSFGIDNLEGMGLPESGDLISLPLINIHTPTSSSYHFLGLNIPYSFIFLSSDA